MRTPKTEQKSLSRAELLALLSEAEWTAQGVVDGSFHVLTDEGIRLLARAVCQLGPLIKALTAAASTAAQLERDRIAGELEAEGEPELASKVRAVRVERQG